MKNYTLICLFLLSAFICSGQNKNTSLPPFAYIDYSGNPNDKIFQMPPNISARSSSVIPSQPVILKQIHSPTSSPMDLEFDGQHLWLEGYSAMVLYQIDTSSGMTIKTLPTNIIRPYGLAFDGSHLFVVDTDNYLIQEIDTVSGTVLNSFPTPADITLGSYPGGLAFDGTFLWNNDTRVTSGSSPLDSIFKITASGSPSGGFGSPNSYPSGLAFDGTYLWSTDNILDLIDMIDTATHSIIASIYAPGGLYPNGLAWDGQYLWCTNNYSDSIYKLDVSSITGINTINSSPEKLIWFSPNPFTEKTIATVSTVCLQKKCELVIYGLPGNKVMQIPIINQDTELNRHHLSPGIYFYTLTGGDEIYAQGKLAIQ